MLSLMKQIYFGRDLTSSVGDGEGSDLHIHRRGRRDLPCLKALEKSHLGLNLIHLGLVMVRLRFALVPLELTLVCLGLALGLGQDLPGSRTVNSDGNSTDMDMESGELGVVEAKENGEIPETTSWENAGKNCFTWAGPIPRVTIMKPDQIKDIFNKINDFQKVTLAKILGCGLACYDGDKWAKHRKIINPAFHVEKLKHMLPVFYQNCNEMISKWDKLMCKDGSCELDAWPFLVILTSDVISRTAFETTSVLLVWTMILLSHHQDWQARAREEVFQVFGNQKPDFDGLNHLRVVQMIFNEVMRLYPPLIVLDREDPKETKLGNLSLPAGVQVSLPILLVHHDHELWGDNAMEFKPERFSDGILKATKNQVSFFPFAWGLRICIGQNFALMEAKMALTIILHSFSFELSPSYVHAPHSVITLQPQHGAHLIIRKL
ncbi:hypothetical protein JRO89_XS15G0071000 [Xanthoceras sorbifolium]|uniref:Cytochrome P450 n=1 Tax=Xanthoceras sorbifolium TaxID=99658 RepID=A0ABQ8H184_9ROSI|nr:hypothetical protein JRO89_XS15G0071000 [Xanthoceras sorbifolium]